MTAESVETLRADLNANIASLKDMGALTTTADLVGHLKNTLWPFQEMLVEHIEELDGCVEDLLNHAEDILQPETGAVFAAVVVGGLLLAGELKKRLTVADDPKIRAVIAEFEQTCAVAQATLAEIVIPDDEAEDEDEEDEEEAEGVEQ